MTTRAREPDAAGYVDRDGVRIAWERHGRGERTLVLLPTWEIADSRIWKLQVPFLARRFTVVTFDPRGHGRSDRPAWAGAYDRAQRAHDTVAVLDAAGVGRATFVSWCGAEDDLTFAVTHPERTEALVLVAPDLLLTETPNEEMYDSIPDWGSFLERFYAHLFSEPHSTKQIEDGVAWGTQTDAETILAGLDAVWENGAEHARDLLGRVRCPMLVVQGSRDEISGPERGAAVAAAVPGARLMTFDGSGHGPSLRDPVRFNLELADFAGDRSPQVRRWARAASRPRKALYVSSPIGLGHARRDLAIADALRARRPGLEIEWLAQPPVTAVLRARGERIHPASVELAGESAHFQAEAHGHDLHCFEALRRMDEILLANFMVFLDVVQAESYDVWICDEAWDVDYFLHENPELKSAAYVWLTDFVGYLPMPDGGAREAALTADYNAEMIEQIARYPRVRDRSIFVGEPEDVVPDTFGEGLPSIREWTQAHFAFCGYVTGFDPAALADRGAVRAELGYAVGEPVCVVTVGGSGVGAGLLERVTESFPEARRLVPGLRMIVVAGPRIDAARLPAHQGLEIRPYVPDLHRHLAACDLAVVQGGLTTGMELIVTGRPFLSFPLGHHFEQQFHVAHRLQRYGATGRMEFEDSPPDVIAAAIAREIGREPVYRPVATDGAARAAALIDSLL